MIDQLQVFYQYVLSRQDEESVKSANETSKKSFTKQKPPDSTERDRSKRRNHKKLVKMQNNPYPIKVNNMTFKRRDAFDTKAGSHSLTPSKRKIDDPKN